MKVLKPLLIALFAISTQFAIAQHHTLPGLNFVNVKSLPYSLVWPATVSNGQYIYAINGYVPEMYAFSANVFRYDPKKDEWSLMSSKAIHKLQSTAVYVPIDGHAYIFGGTGMHINNVYAGIQRLDVETGVSKQLNLLNPMPASYSCAAQWDDKIYLFGGSLGNHTLATMYCFDPKEETFTKLADMPNVAETAGAIVNGTLYTFGGYDQFIKTASKKINAYNIKTDTWTTIGEFPKSVSSTTLAVSGNLIFLVGNYDDETFLGYFDTVTKKFTRLHSNMQGRRAAGAAIINNKLYVFGGKAKFDEQVGGGIKTAQCADITALLNATNMATN